MHMMNNPNTRYCERVMKYMDENMEKATSHTVVAIGNQERRFEVRLANNKFGCANEMRTHEVKIGNEVWQHVSAHATNQSCCTYLALMYLLLAGSLEWMQSRSCLHTF